MIITPLTCMYPFTTEQWSLPLSPVCTHSLLNNDHYPSHLYVPIHYWTMIITPLTCMYPFTTEQWSLPLSPVCTHSLLNNDHYPSHLYVPIHCWTMIITPLTCMYPFTRPTRGSWQSFDILSPKIKHRPCRFAFIPQFICVTFVFFKAWHFLKRA